MTQKNQATAAANDIEWDVISGENTEFAVQYPRMQWVHGEKKASGFNKTGGLFISSEQYPNFTADGFAVETFISRKDEIPGYAASLAHLAIIRLKVQWIKDESRNVPLLHALVVVKGCDDLICLSLRGASKALDFQKAFNQHMAHNVSTANRTRPATAAALEPFALWFPVKSGDLQTITSKDGKNESNVTLPMLDQPEKLDLDYVRKLWVGADSYRQFVGYFKETTAWQKVPIWEQRDAVVDITTDDAPPFSGGNGNGDVASKEQLEFLIGICDAKNFDIKELALTVSQGATENIAILTKAEAVMAIEQAKAA